MIENKKIKILVNVQDKTGVSFHRLLTPYFYLGEKMPNENYDIVMCPNLDMFDIKQLDEFDYIVCNRHIDKINCKSQLLIDKIKKSRAKLIVDMDDLYFLDKDHILYDNYEPFKQDVIASCKAANIITVTHQMLANTLSYDLNIDINKFFVLPNSIDDNQEQFKATENVIGDRLKFGWSGSITHFDDVLLLNDSLHYCYKNYELKDKFSMSYGGYVKNDKISGAIAGVLSSKIADSNQFNLYPVKDVNEYANFYKEINVSLIPLKDNIFNIHKSNLKLLETGFHKRAVICKNLHPYNSLLTKENSIAINNDRDWWKAIEKLIKNPNMVIDLGEQLYLDVQCQSTYNVMTYYSEFLKSIKEK